MDSNIRQGISYNRAPINHRVVAQHKNGSYGASFASGDLDISDGGIRVGV